MGKAALVGKPLHLVAGEHMAAPVGQAMQVMAAEAEMQKLMEKDHSRKVEKEVPAPQGMVLLQEVDVQDMKFMRIEWGELLIQNWQNMGEAVIAQG